MKELRYSTKAKKDLKKYRNDPRKMKKLYEVLDMLIHDVKIPDTFFPHKLILPDADDAEHADSRRFI